MFCAMACSQMMKSAHEANESCSTAQLRESEDSVRCEEDLSLVSEMSVASSSEGCEADVKHFDTFCRFAFPEETSDHSDSTFYFESDHVALKDNADYRRLLRAFVQLESQRTAAMNDLDVLLKLRQMALSDPLQFVSQLQHDGLLKRQFPRPRHIADLPTVDWQRYTDDVEAVLASLGDTAHSTRQKRKRDLMAGVTLDTSCTSSCDVSGTDAETVVREKQRPVTFNQPWSCDEQRLLEQLLKKYPPERFEARRFAKIAAEIPGRTTQQVTSRVQKYFIKLAKAGLPVPGRLPSLAAYGGRWFGGRFHGHHQRYNHFYFPASTFLTSYAPPVYMSDDDNDDDSYHDSDNYTDISSSTGSSHSSGVCGAHNSHYKRVDELKTSLSCVTTVAHQQSNTANNGSSLGADMSHVIDLDYTSLSTGVSSYLDPNYMPAI